MIDTYFMLIYSEAILNQMKTQYKPQIRAALDDCWSFLENKNKTGKELYTLLDDGTDFNGIFIYMQLDEDETNVPSWDNISYAVGSTAKEAYLFDNQKQLPSPLENIDSNLTPLSSEITGERIQTVISVMAFRTLERLRLVSLFSIFYCKGKEK